MAFQCVIVTPEQQALDESATQAIVPAWDGQIGILTDRAPLLVKLGIGALRVDLAGGRSRTFVIDGGIAQMKDNRLTILTNEATAAEDIDPSAASAELTEVEARLPTEGTSLEQRNHQIARARARHNAAEKR